MSISINNLTKCFKYKNKISFNLFNGLSTDINENETTIFIGPKGCGKSMLLKLLAGIENPDDGEIILTGIKKDNVRFYPSKKSIKIIQFENIENNIKKVLKKNRQSSADEILDLFGLSEFRKTYPFHLAGDIRIKFELALIIAEEPELIILDEPFIDLDSYNRNRLNIECLEIFKKLKKTIIISTNDVNEAVILGDRVIVLNENSGTIRNQIEIKLDKTDLNSPDFIRFQSLIFDELKLKQLDDNTEKNNKKINCWEFKKCGREPGGAKVSELGICPAATESKLAGIHGGINSGRACWVVAGTYCKGEVQGSFAQKHKNCEKCEFYKLVEKESSDFHQINSLLIYLSSNEDEEKKKYRNILENMIDPSVVSEALTNLESLKKGGEKKITAFFSDIVSFSKISEKLSNTDLFNFINEYFTAMTNIIKEEKGTIDKYIGDAIVAIFGAPVGYEDTAVHAARAAMRMLKKLEDLKLYWKENNLYCPEVWNLKIRIGLNTGLAKLGFMGTQKLASYTMMGETVNLAQWMEITCKLYNLSILITHSTKKEIENIMKVRYIDYIPTKTNEKSIHIFEISGFNEDVDEKTLRFNNLYEYAVKQYRKNNYTDAIKYLNIALTINKDDKASLIMLNKCTKSII